MIDYFSSIGFTTLQWAVILLSGFLIGMSKAGIQGANLLILPFMAALLGGRNSAGFILPLLIMADVFAVTYYLKKCQWRFIPKLLPFSLVGLGAGLLTGQYISDRLFKMIMSIIILVCLILMLAKEVRKKEFQLPESRSLAGLTGVLGGFSTMIGNAAGPIMSLYFLAMGLPKAEFIGTVAWYFFIVNLIKVPLHVFVWHSITLESFLVNLTTLPLIALGIFVGIKTVHLIPEKAYRYFVIAITFIGAVRLLTG